MNDLNQFPFYKNYYELLDNLPNDDKKLMLEVIVDYMFKNVEPIGLKGMNLAIWNNIKMPLDKAKKNVLNGQKGGRPKKEKNPNDNPNKNPINNPNNNPNDNPKGNQNNIFIFYFLLYKYKYFNNNTNIVNNNNEVNDTNIVNNINSYINKLGQKVKEWLDYKWERKEYYKETGFKSLLKQIEKASEEFGEEKVIELIDECMANNYKGIIFDKLKKQSIIQTKKTSTEILYEKMSEWARKGDERDKNDKK